MIRDEALDWTFINLNLLFGISNYQTISLYNQYSNALFIYLYDFWYLDLAPGPPYFFGSHLLGSATSKVLSY